MMRGQPYTPCKLYYDGARGLEVGHFLQTPAGSAYQVIEIRQDGKRAYRKHLQCVRWPVADIPAEAVVHPLHWYKRERKRARSLASLDAATPKCPGCGHVIAPWRFACTRCVQPVDEDCAP